MPKKGLEPPHPCEYVDLNHARLPIPPLRHALLSGTIDQTRQQDLVSQRSRGMSNGARHTVSGCCIPRDIHIQFATSVLF